MDTLSRSISSKDLRDGLADVLGGVAYRSERVGVTRHGKLTAVMISAEELELFEELELKRDLEEFRIAKATDDGTRVSLEELRAEAS